MTFRYGLGAILVGMAGLLLAQDSSLASVMLANDPHKANPLWNPMRLQRDSGKKVEFRSGTGHFLCLDAFGPVSAEERAAGLPFHGEAHEAQWETRYMGKQGTTTALTLGT